MTASKKTREVELKLTLGDPRDAEKIVALLVALGFEITPGKTVHNEDLYLDTFEWTLLRHGLSLRLRVADGRRLYTLKSVGVVHEGIADRFELEVPVSRKTADPTAITAKAIRRRVDPVIWPRKLLEQVMVRTERRTYRLSGSSGLRVELAFDVSRFQARGLNARRMARRLYEMEAELLRGDAEELSRISRELVERLACRPSARSKLEAAMERLKIAVPSKKPPKRLSVRGGDRFDLAVRKIVSFQLGRFEEHLPGVRLDVDTEFVHQARVATRRMRSALGLFEGAIPEGTAERFRADLGKVASSLGDVRDLDVFLLNLPRFFSKIESSSEEERRSLEHWVLDHRAGAIERLRAYLDSPGARAFRRRLHAYLDSPLPRRPRSPLALKTLGETAPAVILGHFDAVVRRGRKVMQKPGRKNFHKLRIEMKRLRYACEFVTPAYGDALEPFIERTVDIQDCLGELQDTVFTRAFIERILEDWRGKAVDPGMLFVLGEIYQLQGEIARSKQAAFADIWREFDRPEAGEGLRAILRGTPEAPTRIAAAGPPPRKGPSRRASPRAGARGSDIDVNT
jgi:CHAD domain-containing protein